MRYPTDKAAILLSTFTEMLEIQGVPLAEEHAEFLTETVIQLHKALKTGLITEIIKSGMRPRVMLTTVDPSEEHYNFREVGHA